jgi:hypothetical protein
VPAFTVTAPLLNNAAPPFNVSVPAVTVVPPEKVFAPPKTNSPAPDFVSDPAPVIAPLTVSAVVASAFENVDPPDSAIETLLPTVNAPVPDAF